jgi:hypothetical protein
VKAYPCITREQGAGTFADGSFPGRVREVLLEAESEALLHGLVRVGKAKVLVQDCGYGPHLHAGFYGVPVDVEPS